MHEFKISRKKKVAFIDLLRPHQCFSIDERFEIYRWMVATAQNYYKPKVASRGWDSHGHEAIALLSRSSGHGWGKVPERFRADWEEELTLRFQYALLDQFAQSEAIRWRQEQDVDINTTKVLPIRYYSGKCPEYSVTGRMDMPKLLKAIFGFKGAKLIKQHNPFHEKADTILDISIGVYPDYNLCIHYGYAEELGMRTASTWSKDIPSVKDELFWDWLNRSYLVLKQMVVEGDRDA